MGIRKTTRAGLQRRFREVYFDHASTQLGPAYLRRLRAYARHLVRDPLVLIALVGHRDASEKSLAAMRLGLSRAIVVRDVLERLGVAGKRVTVASFADGMPLPAATGATTRAANRRVDILFFGETRPTQRRAQPRKPR